ncbi:hypothetical protein [Methylobacterium sp. SI9]|uniref:hypothetical protein n=1 Tax=Methylobacterium guangdongense TaxID=3138811 RepID=UPI00313D0662
MSVSAANLSGWVANPLATLLSSAAQETAKKADADDAVAAKPAAPKLATTGPGQVLDRKV